MTTISWFSAGVSSAVATKLAIAQIDRIIYTHIDDQHSDTLRFVQDCEEWFGKKVEILQSQYKNVENACLRPGESGAYINGPRGAGCTYYLKRQVRLAWEKKHAKEPLRYVWGIDLSEKHRCLRLEQTMPLQEHLFPLVDAGMSKEDAHKVLTASGIKRPAMYDIGYRNNNCIGCVKGGMGYWNKIRVDFPEIFKARAEMERKVGASCIKGVYLDELGPERGRATGPIVDECGAFCEALSLNNCNPHHKIILDSENKKCYGIYKEQRNLYKEDMTMTGGETLDDLLGFDPNAPLTEAEKKDLQVQDPKEKRPCPVCGKMLTWMADGSRPRKHICKDGKSSAEPVQEGKAQIIEQVQDALTAGTTVIFPADSQLSLFEQPAAPTAPAAGPTVDEVVAKYVATRDLIAEKTKALEAELATLKDFQKKREAWLLGKMDASGVESMRTHHGTCFVDWKDSVSVADPDAFMGWVHEDWDGRRTFLTNAANKTAVKQRLSENELPPPGVSYTKIKDVKIRRA